MSPRVRKAPSAPDPLRIEYVDPATLKPYEQNARQHSPEQIEALVTSIQRFGWGAPLLVGKENSVIAGHGRLQAAGVLKLALVPIVRLEHLSDEQARALRLADNRLAELATWDEELLAGELRELADANFDLDGVGWATDELAELLGDVTDEEETAGEPEIEPPQEAIVSDPGDVWLLGQHRVACGDCLQGKAGEVARKGELASMVLTDPPYAIYGSSSGVSSSVSDDKMVRPFFRSIVDLCQRATLRFAHVYVFCDWRSYPSVFESAKGSRLELKNVVVWEKNGSGLGSFYANTYELLAFFAHCPPQKTMRNTNPEYGHRSVFQANVIKCQRARGVERLHNAAKPLELLQNIIRNSTDEGQLVFDPFGGSGSTLIACELTKRRCAMVDIDPTMVDVTVRRWQRRTQLTVTRESDGKTFDEVALERARK